MYQFQRTIERETSYEGIGLHTGLNVKITFMPAPVNHGVVFIRTDVPERPAITATIENVTDVFRGTTIGCGEHKIHTVEHVLCALAGLGITNISILINAKEPPAIDGSALTFVNLLEQAGIVEQNEKTNQYAITEPLQINEGAKQLIALPSDTFKISFTIDYDNPVIGTQYAQFEINEATFKKEVMSARTFGFTQEVEELRKQGLALGGDLTNAIVVGENGILNETLRYEDEFVRHKILDLVGDLFLTGLSLKGHFVAIKSGHALNVKLASLIKKKFMEQKQAAKSPSTLNIMQIIKILPHRYPFLLVDKITEIRDGKGAVGVKNVTINEHFFTGHFPAQPVMPGVLIVEALAQVAGVFMLSKKENRGKLPYFTGIDNFRFRKPVLPGDILVLEIEVGKIKGNIGKVAGKVTVDGKLVAGGELMFSLVDAPRDVELED
ncbi:MAG: UDP-3-O-(3-hydroxymyristoyl) N-acetylglucosamine deacetylase [bacterium ADurb.Bin243]|nr:MAG: UDP-3-O-(3-hydroxymyristoyl) N-acetylglucosamine deacetylase [bacterium ADurb.Bin243]HOD39812.1 bifunctional UDP-3-O-[3-hydroxymyristoyl] N-acetylglucosamine deacetylase/3-hydroxyacyl-ACP dehydratase [Candidatus Wallbacteria bacterium]